MYKLRLVQEGSPNSSFHRPNVSHSLASLGQEYKLPTMGRRLGPGGRWSGRRRTRNCLIRYSPAQTRTQSRRTMIDIGEITCDWKGQMKWTCSAHIYGGHFCYRDPHIASTTYLFTIQRGFNATQIQVRIRRTGSYQNLRKVSASIPTRSLRRSSPILTSGFYQAAAKESWCCWKTFH